MNGYTVVGGGAIGGTLAFRLAQGGHAVTVVDADAGHVAAIRAGGLRIRRPDGRTERVDVRALAPDEADGPFSAVILAVKAQATADAAAWIAPRLTADGFVVSLQNGLCEPEIAEAVGPERTVAAFVNLFADLVEPGVIADGGPGALVIGEPHGLLPSAAMPERGAHAPAAETGDAESTASRDAAPSASGDIALSASGDVAPSASEAAPSASGAVLTPRVRTLAADLGGVASGNVAGHLWSKLAYSAVAAASATVDAPVADSIEAYPELTAALAREVYAVAAAEGVRPEPFDAWRASAFLPGATDTRAALAEFCAWLRTQPKGKTGIWRDLAVRRRKTEVPALLTPVLTRAERYGLPCPGVRTVLRLIRELEDGTRDMSGDNLRELAHSVQEGSR